MLLHLMVATILLLSWWVTYVLRRLEEEVIERYQFKEPPRMIADKMEAAE